MEYNAKGPLHGIRVLELGTMVAGPVAATLLADFGAEVIKFEQPAGGDPIRQSGPLVDGESLWWNVEGRNKRSLTIDLRTSGGQELLRLLAAKADVIIENFRPGTLARWNAGYPTLREVNPRLVMLSVSGYGQTGPNAPLAAYDRVALAFSGYLHTSGYPDRAPVRPGFAVADYQTALYGAFSVMMALYHRDARGGQGQHLDLSLYETMFRFTDFLITAYDKLGAVRERMGNYAYAASPGDHYQTQDGRYLALTIAADTVFQRLCTCMDRRDLTVDPKFATHRARVENYSEINSIVADWIRANAVDHVCKTLRENGVPHSLAYTVADIACDPHYAARGSIATVENPRLGALKMPAPVPHMSDTPAPALRPAPTLGQDTEGVLEELLGFDAARIAELRRTGII